MLTAAQVRARYGDASAMWLERMDKRPELGFPKPYYYGSRRMWRLGELRAFDRSRPREPPQALLDASHAAVEKRKRGRPRKAQGELRQGAELRPLTPPPPEAPGAPPAAPPRARRRRAHGAAG
jgi:hypothetical protein